ILVVSKNIIVTIAVLLSTIVTLTSNGTFIYYLEKLATKNDLYAQNDKRQTIFQISHKYNFSSVVRELNYRTGTSSTV
ncbi:MAG: hypothetical protein Q8L88_10910, partial [Bacteroidota bacterium]|nr:hypothetical protein [Bacteroidota bacterium]